MEHAAIQKLFRLLRLAMAGPSALCAGLCRETGQPAADAQGRDTMALHGGQHIACGCRSGTTRLGRLTRGGRIATLSPHGCGRSIAHRYPGEAELTERTSAEGAHFSLIEENIAVGSYITTIHQGWLDSPEHRANLLNPQIDRVGIAVVASHGVFFAVADYARTVPVLTSVQVEASFANLIHTYGIAIHRDPSDAHAVCALDAGLPPSVDPRPRYILRWQGAELNRLPQELKDLLASKRYRSAAVGNCSLKNKDEGFTVYRMAVLLY